jgi:lambda repressor-like predicted transcriptional regulator
MPCIWYLREGVTAVIVRFQKSVGRLLSIVLDCGCSSSAAFIKNGWPPQAIVAADRRSGTSMGNNSYPKKFHLHRKTMLLKRPKSSILATQFEPVKSVVKVAPLRRKSVAL